MKAIMHFTNNEVSITIGKPEGIETELYDSFMASIDGRGSLIEAHITNNSIILRRKKDEQRS